MPAMAIDGAEMHYEEVGSGPPLLFGHSYLWDRRMWMPQVEHLCARYRCIVPDLWAHGRSGPPPRAIDLGSIAEHHHALMKGLGIGRYAVAGLSIGGMWGLRLALRHPEAVAALAVFNTSASAEPPIPRARYLSLLGGVPHLPRIPRKILATVVMSYFSPRSHKTRLPLLKRFMAVLEAYPRSRWVYLSALGRSLFARQDILDQVGAIKAPLAVVVGEDDAYRPVRESEALAAAVPGATLTVLPEAGHISNLEQVEKVNALLDDFLGAHWAG